MVDTCLETETLSRPKLNRTYADDDGLMVHSYAINVFLLLFFSSFV
jgi:hypothetical protein